MAFRYLSEESLAAVRTASIELGFNSDGNLDALAAGISHEYIGSKMVGPTPNTKLLTLTEAMNATRMLLNGEVPLSKWLSNAILLAGGTEQELVFREALHEMTQPRPPAEVVAPDDAA